MKKSILALLAVSALSTSAFAATTEVGSEITKDLHFNETVERVCGIQVIDSGTIVFNSERERAAESGATFKVFDNGDHLDGTVGQTKVSIDTTDRSSNLEDLTVKYSFSTPNDARDSIDHTQIWTGDTQEVYAVVDANKHEVPSGEASITATITVHCGN